MKLKPLHQQSVVLFGATSGIGLETAMRMVEKGAKVAIIGRNSEDLDQAVQRVRQHAYANRMSMSDENMDYGDFNAEERVIGIEADATNFESVKAAADRVVEIFGRIDTWVNLAAVSEWALFEDTQPDEFRRIIDVNLTGHAFGAMAALPHMKQHGSGNIIFVSSVTGRVPIPYQSAYSASKHGLVALADTLRMELKHEGVPVNISTIMPSSINTPLFDKARTRLGVKPEPIPPIYDPGLAADVIVHAAERPIREAMVGGAGFVLQAMNRISPRTAQKYLQSTAFKQQRSDEPKSAQAPGNLYQHISGYNQVEGDFKPRTKRFSLYTWWVTHPNARMIVRAALVGGALFLGYRAYQQSRQPKTVWQKIQKNQLQPMQRNVSHMVSHNVQSVRNAMPFRRRLQWWQKIPLISGLIEMLPFMQRPSLGRRVQRTISHVPEMVSERLPSFRRKETMMQRIGHKLPTEQVQKVYESVQDHMPSFRRRQTMMEKITDKLPTEQVQKAYHQVQERMPRLRRREKIFDQLENKLPIEEVKEMYEKVADRMSSEPEQQTEIVYEKQVRERNFPFGRGRMIARKRVEGLLPVEYKEALKEEAELEKEFLKY